MKGMKGWSRRRACSSTVMTRLRAASRSGEGSAAVTSDFDSSMYQSQKSSQKK
jgi:hypothetical protein